MLLHLSTWSEIDDYLKRSTGIIVPIGSTEQHGPNGLIGTDAICPEFIGRKIGEKTGALVGPTINVGMAQHHLGFSGSIALRPSTLMMVIKDYVTSLTRHGFERFFFLNGHGGNIATATAAFSEIYAEASFRRGSNAPSVRCTLRGWWESEKVRAISAELYGDKDGSHATASEVSVTQYAYPEAIKHAAMEWPGKPARGFYDAEDYRRQFPDGRIGSDPSMATPEAGKRLVEASVEDLSEDYKRFLAQA
ncbi:MAG: creatininase family protein [Proteobacteria bacterium]|nr:creatininase family protein [Pseudomonadota bacterium]MBI3499146.1 creatininase family protein [Pseudomonadota bacterium]